MGVGRFGRGPSAIGRSGQRRNALGSPSRAHGRAGRALTSTTQCLASLIHPNIIIIITIITTQCLASLIHPNIIIIITIITAQCLASLIHPNISRRGGVWASSIHPTAAQPSAASAVAAPAAAGSARPLACMCACARACAHMLTHADRLVSSVDKRRQRRRDTVLRLGARPLRPLGRRRRAWAVTKSHR